MSKPRKKMPIINKYNDKIIYTCPVRGIITQIVEVRVFGTTLNDDGDLEYINLDEITTSY